MHVETLESLKIPPGVLPGVSAIRRDGHVRNKGSSIEMPLRNYDDVSARVERGDEAVEKRKQISVTKPDNCTDPMWLNPARMGSAAV